MLSRLIILGLSKDFVELLSADWLTSGSVNGVHFVFVPTSLQRSTVSTNAENNAVNLMAIMELHVLPNGGMDVSVTKCPGLANVVKKTISE